MHEMVRHPEGNNGANREDIDTAFGQHADLARIDENITRMQQGTMKISSASASRHLTNDQYAAAVVTTDDNDKPVIVDGREQHEDLLLGPGFHGLSLEDQAGMLNHEASHYLAGTSDHVLKDSTPGAAVPLSIYQPGHGLTNAELKKNEACQ